MKYVEKKTPEPGPRTNNESSKIYPKDTLLLAFPSPTFKVKDSAISPLQRIGVILGAGEVSSMTV